MKKNFPFYYALFGERENYFPIFKFNYWSQSIIVSLELFWVLLVSKILEKSFSNFYKRNGLIVLKNLIDWA